MPSRYTRNLSKAAASPTKSTIPVDVTGPTITSGNPSQTVADGVTVSGTLTANESVIWTKTGTHAHLVVLNALSGVWSVTANYSVASTLSFPFLATDGANNPSTAQVVSIPVTASGGGTPTAPTLNKLSASGVSPMSWEGTYTGLTVGDVIRMKWTKNGVAQTEGTHTVTDDDLIWASEGSYSFTWPLFAATVFANNDAVSVQERVERGANLSSYSTAITDTVVKVTLSWTPEATGAGQDIGFGSSTATFNNINFGAGQGIVMLTSKEARITGVTIGGVAATLIGEGSSTSFAVHVSMWRAATTSGLKTVVATGVGSLGPIVPSSGTLTGASSPAATSIYASNTDNDPRTIPSITVPAGGVAVGVFGAKTGGNATMTSGTEDSEIGNGTQCRQVIGRRTTTGTFAITGWAFAEGAGIAAAWG